MPYKNIDDLPERVKSNLPKHAKEIFLEAFNHAWDKYKDPKKRKGNSSREKTSFKVGMGRCRK